MKEKEKLIDLLDDIEVIDKIRKIVSVDSAASVQEKTCSGMYSEADLREQLVRARNEYEVEADRKMQEVCSRYEDKLVQKQNEVAGVQAECLKKENEIQELTEKIRCVKDAYHEIEDLYDLYSQLSETQLSWFDRVLHADNSRTDSPVELLVRATQKDNLMAMWQIITTHVSDIIKDRQERMFYRLFEICFNLYAKTTRGNASLIVPSVGEEYDPLKHSKTADSRSSGKITEVLFPGFRIENEKNKPIITVAK